MMQIVLVFNIKNMEEEIVKYILEEWDNFDITPEEKILKAKRNFLINKFSREIENLKYGTMQEYLKYYVQFFKDNHKTMSLHIVHTLFEIINGTHKKPNVVVFSNGVGNYFDVFTFDKGKGQDFVKRVPVYASLIDGEFIIHSELYIPNYLYNAVNYEYVLENY